MKSKLIIAAVVLFFIVGYPALVYSTEKTLDVTVVKSERVTSGSGDSIKSTYLVWTENSGVFENADTILYGKFNSSDLYTEFKPGARLTIKVVGWRLPFLSSYPNIVEIVNVR